jgi:Ca2+:H+ antiporter
VGLSARERSGLAAIAVATVAAAVANYAGAPAILAFVVAAVALAGQAWLVSFATEQVGEKLGPAATGFLQSTLGNLPELFVVIFALHKGEVVVAQTSIIGSLLANGLLVLGLVIVVGARKSDDRYMRFSKRLPNDTATLLLVTTFIIVIVAVAASSHDAAGRHVQGISIVAAIALLAVYGAWVVPYLRTGGHEPGAATAGARIPVAVAAVLLGVAGVAAALTSDWFITALRPAIDQLGISAAFAGLVVVAIAGNAVENAVGLVLAAKGNNDLAVSVIKNSVVQIAAFLYPVLIIISLLFATHLTFALAPVYVVALGISALLIWQVTGDGEAAEFEGWALVAVYVIIGAITLYE